jgi:hypothetical protein
MHLCRATCDATARAVVFCILVVLPGVGGGGVARGQAGDSSEEVIEKARTRSGELSLARRKRDEAVTLIIRLDGKVVAEKEASEEGDAYSDAGLYGTYPARSPRYALVRLSTGSLVCASKFTIVDLSSGSGARATEDFGNCSDVPRVTYRNDSLTITFPAGPGKHDPGTHYVGPGQVWSYRGGRLRRIDRRR